MFMLRKYTQPDFSYIIDNVKNSDNSVVLEIHTIRRFLSSKHYLPSLWISSEYNWEIQMGFQLDPLI